jgi:hypothetical protein
MKKIAILFLALFLAVTSADAVTWVRKSATIDFNDCPTGLKVVRYGLNYITSGGHRGDAVVYVTVRAMSPVLRGCAYYKVYTTDGQLIYKGKKRIKLSQGSERNYFTYIPASRIGGRNIKAEIGVGCGCGRGGY